MTRQYSYGSKNTSSGSKRNVQRKATGGEKHADANPIMQLQQAIGNRAVSQYLQRKASSEAVQRMEMPEVEEEELQMKADPNVAQRMEMPEVEEEELQMKRAPGGSQQGTVQRKSNGMPIEVQAKMESAMGADFSDVSIHQDGKAEQVGALAYAQGNDIHFASGQYNPDSVSGQELLGHELTHVVQQRQGRVQPTNQVSGVPINDDPKLENEADALGRKAASMAIPQLKPAFLGKK